MTGSVPISDRLGAVEAGGTWIRCAVGTADGKLQHQERKRTGSPAETMSAITDFFEAHSVSALGVGFFGPLDRAAGRLGPTPKPGWSGASIREPLSSLGIPMSIDTDVNAAVLGEAWRGAGRGAQTVLYLTVGTGIGGGLLQGEHLVGGRLHPEVGHMMIPREADDLDFDGVCPFHGACLEGLASGPAMAARWGRPGAQLEAGHPAWDLEARILAAGLQNVAAACAPDRVILGGGVGSNPALWGPLREHLGRTLGSYWPDLDPADWVVAPGLGADSALTGCLRMAARERGC